MNWFDLVVVVIVLLTFVKGFMSGLVMQIASLVGIILGAVFAGQLAPIIEPYLLSWTGGAPHIIAPLSFIIAFLLILMALILAGKLIQSLVDALSMSILNRLAGALFCAAKWIIIFSIAINLLAEFDQNKRIISEEIRTGSQTYPFITEIARTVIPYLRFDWF